MDEFGTVIFEVLALLVLMYVYCCMVSVVRTMHEVERSLRDEMGRE